MKKIFASLIILTLVFAPTFSIAATVIDTQNNTQQTTSQDDIYIPSQEEVDAAIEALNADGSQAQGATQGAGSTTNEAQQAQEVLAGLGSCAISTALSSLITSYVSQFIDVILSPFHVPVNETDLRGKETGTIGSLNLSWDSIGYCIVNTIIDYIGYSTVQWINSGFEGNPVFVDNPEQFLSDIADIEAGNFLAELSGGYLCSPLQAPIRINLTNSYYSRINPFSDRAACTFTEQAGSLDQFIAGETFSWVDWNSYNQPYNNQFTASIYGQIELDRRIANALNTQSTLLDWGRGFLSFKDPETGEINSPGSLIEQQVNRRLGNPEQRILMADEFDEIVNALVNQLIRVAISEVVEITR